MCGDFVGVVRSADEFDPDGVPACARGCYALSEVFWGSRIIVTQKFVISKLVGGMGRRLTGGGRLGRSRR